METTARTAAPLAWARVLGRGAIQLEYGHGVAVSGAGRVLVAARFDAPEGPETDAANAGQLVQLAANGSERWRVMLANATHLRAPAVALDDKGAAYVAGPYEPSERGTLDGSDRVCVTQLDAEGRATWSEPIARMSVVVQNIPVQPSIALAADPHGGACAAWTESGAIRVARFSAAGAPLWERRFPFRGSVDPRVGLALDATGAALVWGAFSGAIRFEGAEGPALRSHGWDRFFARVQLDGALRWSQVLRATQTDYAIAVHRDGAITLAAVVKPRAGEERDPAVRDVYVARLDATGSAIQRERFAGMPHACARLVVASTGADEIALAGYFSGSFTIAGQEVRSATAASESVLVARLGGAGRSWVRALHAPELQAGLSVHGDALGAVLLAGWCAGGAMDLGGKRIEAGERAAFFVGRYRA